MGLGRVHRVIHLRRVPNSGVPLPLRAQYMRAPVGWARVQVVHEHVVLQQLRVRGAVVDERRHGSGVEHRKESVHRLLRRRGEHL
eukprot:1421357-Pyramimonas_sp.AAC.1